MRKLFPSQQDDEKIYVVVREHWLLLAGKLVIWLLFALGLVLFQYFGEQYVPGLFEGTPGEVIKLLSQIYTLFLTLTLFFIWLIYYLNVQVVTDRRIVDVDQVGLFSHTVSELHIENIEDVTSKTNGILGNLFNFGYVYIQTAGAKERFEFNNIPNPASVSKTILDLYEKIPHRRKAGND